MKAGVEEVKDGCQLTQLFDSICPRQSRLPDVVPSCICWISLESMTIITKLAIHLFLKVHQFTITTSFLTSGSIGCYPSLPLNTFRSEEFYFARCARSYPTDILHIAATSFLEHSISSERLCAACPAKLNWVSTHHRRACPIRTPCAPTTALCC
jgi:hypothetical protein